VQETHSSRASGTKSKTLHQLVEMFGVEAAYRKATWCEQRGLVQKDEQDPNDRGLWLYEISIGARSECWA